jgi:hypothetical protein
MAKKFEDLTPGEKLEKITGTKNVQRPPYDPSNPHTEYNSDDPVTKAMYVKTMNNPVERDKYRKKLDEYDAAQRAKKSKAEYPDQQKELKDLYETGISDKDIAAAKGNKKGGAIKAKKMASGGKVSQLAKANGIAVKGKTRGRII